MKKKLKLIADPNQDSPLLGGNYPIFGIDVWEHAYYLKYHNVRADYVKAFFQVLNWDYVSGQFAASPAPPTGVSAAVAN